MTVSTPRKSVDRAVSDDALRESLGYHVIGHDGDLGVVAGVREAGRPKRPLVLVVRDDRTMRLVSPRRVAAVLPEARAVLLEVEMRSLPDGGVGTRPRRSASSLPSTKRSRT